VAGEVVGKATYETDLDRTGLQQGLAGANADMAKAGKAGEEAFGKSAAAGPTAWGIATKAAAVAGAAAFGTLAIAAGQAQRTQGEFMAATGKSREEAKLFVNDLNSLAGSSGAVGRSWEEMSRVGTGVAQQMGGTREEIRQLTDQVLTFSKATGGDATTNVGRLDDTMDAWNLTAADAGPLLDVITKGTQQYGGVAGDTLQTLGDMAPALAAANLGWQDGAAMINLFNEAGVPAEAITTAFNKALQEVESPEELQQLIDDISATEDPFARAEKAAELFGTRAGPKMAAALGESGGDLDAYAISIDEAAGATQQAADDMMTDADRIRGVFDKIAAGARTLGQELGPALTGAAGAMQLLGPLVSKFRPLFAGLGAALVPAAAAAGAATGAAQGEAHAVASTGPTVLASMKTKLAAMGTALGPSGTAMGKGLGLLMGVGLVVGLAAAAPEISEGANNLGHDVGRSVFGGLGDEAKGLLHGTVADTIFDGIHMAWDRIGTIDPLASARTKWLSYLRIFATESGEALAPLEEAFYNLVNRGVDPEKAYEMAKLAGRSSREGWIDGVTQGPQLPPEVYGPPNVTDDWEDAGADNAGAYNASLRRENEQFMEQTGMRMAAQAGAAARAAHDALADEINDGMPRVKDSWAAYVDAQKNALDPMKEIAGREAKLSGERLARDLASTNPLVRRRAEEMRDTLIREIAQLQGLMGTEATQAGAAFTSKNWAGWGSSAANELYMAFKNKMASRNWDAATAPMDAYFHGQSPPPKGRLHYIDKWGEGLGETLIGGVGRGIDRALPGALAGAQLGAMLQPLVGSSTGTLRHVVELDLRNAPPGVTSGDVAAMLQPVTSWDALWTAKMQEAQAATGVRWVEAR